MALNENTQQLFQGFSKLNLPQRLERLKAMGALSIEDIQHLHQSSTLSKDLAEQFIENVIGYYQLPLGVAANFKIDGIDKVIPMAVEETSIIAALSKTAKWIRDHGTIETAMQGHCAIGQIQIANVSHFTRFNNIITQHKSELIRIANEESPGKSMAQRGGGVKDIRVRAVARPDGGTMAVIHLHVDTCDAMGANIIIQICEYLQHPIMQLTGEQVTMCILSNLNDTKLSYAKVTLNNIDAELGEKIQEASLFAECDAYRAATHNKGVLNGIDPILIATGNDWRAVEANIHAYAAQDGHYKAVSTWRYHNKQLIGEFKAPIPVGIIGGMTRLHPTAKMCLNILDVQSADELSRIIAAVGLVQNLGALRALITLGFTQGHMKLHITNLSLSAGAAPEEIPELKKQLEKLLAFQKSITLTNAKETLNTIRHAKV